MKACVVAVGSELLTPFRVDTNSLAITERLNAIGFEVRLKAVVGDDGDELAAVLETAFGSADLVVCTGGLGPTADDLTRETVARVLDMPLVLDQAIEERLRQRFALRGLTMAEINRRQAMVPRGAIALENANGTAPGLWIERRGADLLLLPGPPREMIPMLEHVIVEYLAPKADGVRLFRRVLKITGRTESDVDATVEPVYTRWLTQTIPISTTILAAFGQIELHLTAATRAEPEARATLDEAVRELRHALGTSVYSDDGRRLEEVVGDILRDKGLTVAAAESCTGGLLTSRLTDIPGSSAYVERSAVCYSNRSKVELLGVSQSVLDTHGAVSEPVALAMADGIKSSARADIGIGVTGIAGPGGGTPDKPVGTVVIAVMTPWDENVSVFRFPGSREQVKGQATQAALNMLRLLLLHA